MAVPYHILTSSVGGFHFQWTYYLLSAIFSVNEDSNKKVLIVLESHLVLLKTFFPATQICQKDLLRDLSEGSIFFSLLWGAWPSVPYQASHFKCPHSTPGQRAWPSPSSCPFFTGYCWFCLTDSYTCCQDCMPSHKRLLCELWSVGQLPCQVWECHMVFGLSSFLLSSLSARRSQFAREGRDKDNLSTNRKWSLHFKMIGLSEGPLLPVPQVPFTMCDFLSIPYISKALFLRLL